MERSVNDSRDVDSALGIARQFAENAIEQNINGRSIRATL